MSIVNGNVDQLSSLLGQGRISAFICSSSFEQRCLTLPNSIDANSVEVALIVHHDNASGNTDEHFKQLCRRFMGKAQEVMISLDDPLRSADAIANHLAPLLVGDSRRIVVDITTFTRESLLILLAYFRVTMRRHDTLELVYAHAKEYSVGDPQEQKWLSKGIKEVRSVLGFAGEIVPSRSTHLIVLVGFEDERALSLVQEFEPTFVSLGLGDRSEQGTKPHQETNEDRFRRLTRLLPDAHQKLSGNWSWCKFNRSAILNASFHPGA